MQRKQLFVSILCRRVKLWLFWFFPPAWSHLFKPEMLPERGSPLCERYIFFILKTQQPHIGHLWKQTLYMFNSHMYWRQHGFWLKLQPFKQVLSLGQNRESGGRFGRCCCCPKWELSDQTALLAALLSWGRGEDGGVDLNMKDNEVLCIQYVQLLLKTDLNHWTQEPDQSFKPDRISIMTSACFTDHDDTKKYTTFR